MTLRFLLDTNTLSEPLKRVPNEFVMKRLRDHDGECATAAVVWHELVLGAARLPPSKRRDHIENYLANIVRPAVPILGYDELAAKWHARERAHTGALGITRPFVDGQIAAIAVTRELVLVTRNAGDFADFCELVVENWFV